MTKTCVRGACPSLPAPMETGDGLLARLLPVAPMALDAFIGLCQAALVHGNGTIEISARGSLQIRGLTPQSAPRFAAAIAALGIDAGERVPIIADPLPDDPAALIDADALAARLRRAIAEAALTLAPKVSVVVDGGGRLDLDALSADIRLRAFASGAEPKCELALTGDAASAAPVAIVSVDDAVDAVLALLAAIAARGADARAGDIVQTETGPLMSRPTLRPLSRAHPVGHHPVKGGACAFGLGLAFGHANARDLIELARIAGAGGAGWARPAPARALLLGPLSESKVLAIREAAERLGFVTEASDPRRRIAACPGAPSCAHGLIAARTLAAEIARHVSLPGDGIALHVSGCAKGCAHAKAAPLTIVGTEQGCGLLRDGTARDKPIEFVDPDNLVATLHRMAGRAREAVHA